MDFRDEKSKIYYLGENFIYTFLIILAVAYFLNRNNRELADIIFIIQQIFVGLFCLLSGIKLIVAKKNKIGILNCTFGGFILIFIILLPKIYKPCLIPCSIAYLIQNTLLVEKFLDYQELY